MGAPAEPWRKVPPCCYDDETEQRVAKREDPSWSFVVQDALQPILDEASGVRCCASLGAQPHFEGCERTYGTKPSLCDYNGNGSQMRSPKPQCIYPVPGAQIANDDEDEAADDEHDDGDVQREHYIGQKLIWKRVVHTRCLTPQANRRPTRGRKPAGGRPVERRVRPHGWPHAQLF